MPLGNVEDNAFLLATLVVFLHYQINVHAHLSPLKWKQRNKVLELYMYLGCFCRQLIPIKKNLALTLNFSLFLWSKHCPYLKIRMNLIYITYESHFSLRYQIITPILWLLIVFDNLLQWPWKFWGFLFWGKELRWASTWDIWCCWWRGFNMGFLKGKLRLCDYIILQELRRH